MSLDLDKLDLRAGSDAGFELELRHPATNEPLGTFLTVVGRDGTRYKQKQAEIKRRRLTRLASGSASSADTQVIDEEAVELVAACVTGWRGLLAQDQEVVFSESKAREIFARHEWIYEQVDAAIHQRANFLTGGAMNSSRSPATSST